MANEKILLRAEANKLGIKDYRTMGLDELKAAIAGVNKPAKGKTATASPNGSKGKTAAKEVVKGKTETVKKTKPKTAKKKTSAPAKKSTARKSTPKASAAKGKVSRAGTKTAAKPRKAKSVPARADIDRTQIDWRLESGVGQSGKRQEVMDALRKYKGNYDKCFDALAHRAKSFYKDKSKHEAERMLRWLINRVAYDYVMSTEQHEPGERAAYGTSKADQDIRRRERREEDRKEREKADRAAKRKKKAAKK